MQHFDREFHPCRSFTSILRNRQHPVVVDTTDRVRERGQDIAANTADTADPNHNTNHNTSSNDPNNNSHYKTPSHNTADPPKEPRDPTSDRPGANQPKQTIIDTQKARSHNPTAVIQQMKNPTVQTKGYLH